MRQLTVPITTFIVAAIVSHALMVAGAPLYAVSKAFKVLKLQGVDPNEINVSPRKRSGEELVGMANPDIFAVRVMLDLSAGPMVFEAFVPPDQAYWSITIFGSNTDVVGVVPDQVVTGGRARVVLATDQQSRDIEADDPVVTLPDARGYAYIRSIPTDVTDPAITRKTLEVLERTTLKPLS